METMEKLSANNTECIETLCDCYNVNTNQERCTYKGDITKAPCRMVDKDYANYLKEQDDNAYKLHQVRQLDIHMTEFFGFILDNVAKRDDLMINENGTILDTAIVDSTISMKELSYLKEQFLKEKNAQYLEKTF